MFIKYFAENNEFFPMEVQPPVDLKSDYYVSFDFRSKRIDHILNSTIQKEVMFYDMVLNEMQGYVSGTQVDIWTQVIDHETLNIIHFHVNDTSDEVTLDVVYMHQGEDVKEFYTFGEDVYGRPLKYKIIVKDCKIHKVLYKESSEKGEVHEIPFNE